MKLLTPSDVLTTCGKHPERLKFVTPQIEANASIICERGNALLVLFGEYRELTSGFRDKLSNTQQGGAKRSWHIYALALDFADADRRLEKFIADGVALTTCRLWAEAPDAKTRTHVQSEAPRGWKPGDRRIFQP